MSRLIKATLSSLIKTGSVLNKSGECIHSHPVNSIFTARHSLPVNNKLSTCCKKDKHRSEDCYVLSCSCSCHN